MASLGESILYLTMFLTSSLLSCLCSLFIISFCSMRCCTNQNDAVMLAPTTAPISAAMVSVIFMSPCRNSIFGRGGLRTFSWRQSRSHSLALSVLYRAHPTKRPFDALVVVPADAVVDRDEHLVTGTLLPMPGVDGFRLHAPEEPLRGRVVRGTALHARRPCQVVAVRATGSGSRGRNASRDVLPPAASPQP